MSERIDIVNCIYNQYDEDARLVKARNGQLEYFTTMTYLHRYLKKGDKILEVGAGTGRYSIALAEEGYDVTALELVSRNLDVLRENAKGIQNLSSEQGDATDLSRYPSELFDATLVLGPMYHLYERSDVQKAIAEAVRVTKPGGVLFFAFLPIYAIMAVEYHAGNFQQGIEENFTKDFRVKHFARQGFTGYDVKEFETLFRGRGVKHLKTLSADGVLELAKRTEDFGLTDEDFALYRTYHLAICEKRELLGLSNHLLAIYQKI